MNSGSGQKLSLEELKQLHQPTTTQTPAQEQTPLPEVHPTKEWTEMIEYLDTLWYHTDLQTNLLKKVSELLTQLPTRTQVDELLKVVKHLERMGEQAGNPKEKRFSLPSISLPRLRLPRLDGPAWAVLLMAGAALLLLWWGLDTVWNSLSLLNL